jgi:hypothetical protein
MDLAIPIGRAVIFDGMAAANNRLHLATKNGNIVLCQACFESCHSALDAESSTISKSGFPLEFIPHTMRGGNDKPSFEP